MVVRLDRDWVGLELVMREVVLSRCGKQNPRREGSSLAGANFLMLSTKPYPAGI